MRKKIHASVRCLPHGRRFSFPASRSLASAFPSASNSASSRMYAQQSELVRHRSSCALLSLFPRSSPSSCASLSPARARDLFVAAPVSSATAFAPQLLTSHLSPVPPSAHWTRAPQKRSFFSSPADSAPRPEATSAPFEDFDFTFRTLRRRRWRPPRTVSPIAVPRPAAPSSAGAESPSAPPEGSDHGGDEAAEAPERALPYGYSTLAELEGRWVRLALKNVLTRTRPRRGGGPPSPSALASRFADESIEGPASKAMRRDVSGEQRPPEMKPLTLLAEAPTLAESLAFLREPRETSTEAPGDTAGTAGLVREGDEGTEGERARALEVDAADEAFEVAADEPDGDASDEVASGLPEGAFARGDGRDALDVEAELGVYVHPKWSRTIEKLERLLPRMAVHDVCLCLRYLAQASLLEHRVALGCIYTLRQKAEDLTAREIGVLCDFLNKPFFRRAAQQLAKGDSEPVPGRESSGLNPARRSDPPPQAAALASRGARDGCSGAAGRRRRSDDAACEETAPLRRGQEWHASDVLDAKARRRALKRQRLADLVAEQELTLRKLRQLVRAKCHDLQHANDVCSVLWTFHAHGLLSASLLGTVRRLLLQRLRGSPEPNPEVPSSASSSPSSQAFRNSLLPRHMASLVAFFLRTGLLDRELFRALTSACLSEASASRFSAAPPSSTPPAATRAGAPAGFVGDGSAESADAKKARTRQEQKLGVWLAARLQGKDLLRLSEGLVAVTAASPLSLLASSSAASPVAEFYGGDDEELRSRAEEYTLAMALQIAAVRKHRSLSGSALSTLLFYSATLASQLPGVCVLPELAYRASTHLAWRTSEFSLSAQAQFLSALPALSAVLPPDPLLVSALADSLSSSLLSLSAPASPSPPSPAGALPLLSLSWAAVASLLALYQRSAASHAVAAAAERIRRRHYLDLFLLLSAPTSSRCLPCGKPPPAALHSASSPPLPMDSDPPPALSAEARLCVEYGGADGDRNASGDAFASCSAHSAMGIGELRLADNRHERVHGQLPALAATASSSLEYLDPPPLPASLLQQAQAEQHLLSLRDALEAATEALAASQLPAGGAGSADALASAQSRVQAASSVRTSHVSGAKEALPTLVQVVLWSQIAAASCASQASERVLRSAFRCLRRLLGAPETAAALAGSCRAAATAVVGLQSPDTQTASGLGARLACLAALWQNVSVLRCRDSGVLYPLVEAADAFAEARADARQPAMPGDAFGKPRQENGKREEDLLTAVSVDILLSACELQALDLLSECTRRALLQTAVNRLSSLSTGSLLSLLQSALLCTADAEARAGVGGASDAPALSAQRLPVSACGSGGAAAPPLVPHNPDSITLAGSPLSPAPSRQSAAEAYGQLLPCVMREAATRFQAGGYIPPASHLPLLLLARRFLLAPCFSSLLARRGAGGVGGGCQGAESVAGGREPLGLLWGDRDRQAVRAFLKHLAWRETAAGADPIVHSNRLPAAAPLLCCSFSPFAPALPRSQTSACCSSPASRVAGDLQARPAQSPESGSTSAWGHVGDCLWVARGTWAGRWTSAFANAVAIAASQETNSAAASGTQARPAQRPVLCWGQSHAGGGGLDSDPPGPQTASKDSGLGGAARESNPSRRGGPPAHSRDEQDLALALDAANSRQRHTAPSGGSHEDELGTQVAFVVVHTAQPAACLGAYPSRGAEPGGRFGLQALSHVERECPGAKLAPGAFSPSSGGVQVRLRPCLLEGVEVDGVAQWPDGRMWGLLFDREEFWYRGSQSCGGNSRVTRHPTDRAPVLQLYVHLVTRLGRCGLAVVKRQESAPLTVFEAGGD